MEGDSVCESKLAELNQRLKELLNGDPSVSPEQMPIDGLGEFGDGFRELVARYKKINRQLELSSKFDEQVNQGIRLPDVLEGIYREFKGIIPYNRIGVALLEQDGQVARSSWAKCDKGEFELDKGYSKHLAGSSLAEILDSGKSRVINDLEEYLRQHPDSESTQLILKEGYRSSLTCPLVTNGRATGFIFFSSSELNTYKDEHVQTYEAVASQLSSVIEKGRLISEVITQQEELEESNEELRHLNELKNSFVGMAAHDIRSPVSVIKNICETLIENREILNEEEHKRFLEIADRKCEYMLGLIDKLLDVSLIESGNLNLQLENIDLGPYLREAAQDYRKLAATKNISIILESFEPANLRADYLRLRQILDNLLTNAIKFSPVGSEIRISTRAVDGGREVRVADQGPGFSAEDLKQLFQDFKRLSAKPTNGEQSVGLGLAITRRIVNAHNGEIGVDSDPEEGSEFWFVIPS